MKVVYYRILLTRANNLSPNEKILYSFLVSKSIESIEDIFDYDGQTIRIFDLYRILEKQHNRIKLAEINHCKLSRILNITRQTIINSLHNLIELDFIREINGCLWIYASREMVDCGFFELSNIDKLSGELLIFYSYLKDKSKKYDYCIDTYKSKIAEKLCKTTIAITKLLNRLYKLGLAKRLSNNKLLIL